MVSSKAIEPRLNSFRGECCPCSLLLLPSTQSSSSDHNGGGICRSIGDPACRLATGLDIALLFCCALSTRLRSQVCTRRRDGNENGALTGSTPRWLVTQWSVTRTCTYSSVFVKRLEGASLYGLADLASHIAHQVLASAACKDKIGTILQPKWWRTSEHTSPSLIHSRPHPST